MADLTEVEDLRAEVEALRVEVERLRGLVSPPAGSGTYYPQQNMWISPQNAWGANAAAGCYAGQVYTVLPGEELKIWNYNTGCAPAGAGTVFTFNTIG